MVDEDGEPYVFDEYGGAKPEIEFHVPDEWEYTCLLNVHPLMKALGALRSTDQDHPTTAIVIRDEYATLLKQLEGSNVSFVVTGQPSVGRTDFILFSAEGAKIHHGYSGHLPALDDLWALSDSNATMEPPCDAFVLSQARVIQAISPAPEWWRHWLKQRRDRIMFTDLPTLSEIGTVATKLGLNPVEAAVIARKWGPCIRTVLNILRNPGEELWHEEAVKDAAERFFEDPFAVVIGANPRMVDSRVSDLLYVSRLHNKDFAVSFILPGTMHLNQIMHEAQEKASEPTERDGDLLELLTMKTDLTPHVLRRYNSVGYLPVNDGLLNLLRSLV
ncbi:hypothetical protein C8Q74DRAFT_1058026 [Fomes fomentarius]|nr:hypothetical protein C8Q74DRAFT_1058026 [Fomes fomentarius]